MFNRSEILRSAWLDYRTARSVIWAAGDDSGKRIFIRALFAKMLCRAWEAAKKVAALAASFVDAQARVAIVTFSHVTPEARSVRIVEISDELTRLDYAPFGVRTSHRRTHLAAELSALNAASTAA